MQLKKGMRVQLKAWLHADDTRLSIMDAMKHYFGRVVTVATDPDKYGDFQIVDGDGWYFTEDWVARICSKTNGDALWDKSMLKKGTRVRLKARDLCSSIHNGPHILAQMDEWFGEIVVVEQYPAYDSGVRFTIKESPYTYHTSWVESIVPKEKHTDLRLIRLRRV